MTATGRAVARVAITCALLVAADQAIKALVRADLELGERHDLPGPLDLLHIGNTGVAFGAFSGGGAVVLVLVALALVALCSYFWVNRDRRLVWLPTGLVLGGAIGNLVDRIRLGHVTDFLKLPHWPAFNLADICISGGVILLLLVVEFGRDRDEKG